MKDFDTILVGFDHSHGDPAVLIVGRKAPRDNVQIINQFQGKEAEELYQKLVGEEKKAMDIEIQKELAEYDRKHIAEIDATILWVLHEQFGFGAQRLRTYYDAFHDRIKELVSRYEMEDQDDIWLCTQMLKRIGVDIEAWHKESDHGT